MNIKSVFAATLAAGAIGAAAALTAAPANADTYYTPSGNPGDGSVAAYHSDVTTAGIPGSYTATTNLGNIVCDKLRAGHSEDILISALMAAPSPATSRQAKVIVWAAEWHFCPSYY